MRGEGREGRTIVKFLIDFKDQWPSWIRFVATSRTDKATEALEPLVGASISVQDERHLKDIEVFVESKIADSSKASTICQKANGAFMYARFVVDELLKDPDLDLDVLVDGLANLYTKRYETSFPEDTDLDAFDEHTKPMLSVLLAARAPLPEDLVQNAGIDPNRSYKRSFLELRKRHLDFVKKMCNGDLVEMGVLELH